MKENTYPQMKILETKNCILRPASIEDAKDMFEYYSVPEVVKYLPIKKHNSLSDTTKFIKLFFLQNYNKGKIGHYAIVYKSDNKVIGNVGFNNILPSSKSGEIGICINPNYWGKNLSMELCLKILEFGFVDLNLNKVFAIIYEQNNYSRKPLEALGFTYLGTTDKHLHSSKENHITCYKYEIDKEYYFKILIKVLNTSKYTIKHKKRNDRFGKSK